jgi:hypothetical protein
MTAHGRPRLLTEAMIERIVAAVELGLSLEAAARSAGVSPRSFRRWTREGRRELDGLSPVARLVLAVDQAEERAQALDWREATRKLEALAAEPFAFDDLA